MTSSRGSILIQEKWRTLRCCSSQHGCCVASFSICQSRQRYNLPADIFLNTAGDIHLLPKVLDAASRFATRPSDDDMTAMLAEQRLTTLFGIGPAS
jgi:hypothetical protein